MIYCNLAEDVNTCPHFIREKKACIYHTKCSFQRTGKQKEAKKEKWYKKYYRS